MAGQLRTLDLKSGGPWFKSSILLLSGFVLGSLCGISNIQLLFTVSPISTTVLNTYDVNKVIYLFIVVFGVLVVAALNCFLLLGLLLATTTTCYLLG